MKNLLLLLVCAAALMVACESKPQYDVVVNDLNTKVDSTTNELSTLLKDLRIAQAQYFQLMAEGKAVAGKDAATLRQIETLGAEMETLRQSLLGIDQELRTYALSNWQQQQELMKTLKTQVEGKQIPEDVETRVQNLQEGINNTLGSLSSWKEKMAALQAEFDQKAQQYRGLIAREG